MTEQANQEPETQNDSHTSRMKLRSNGPLLPQPSKQNDKVKNESLIGDQQLDEQRIIREFKIKRKLLMKALKLKCKQNSTISAIVQSFQVKDGICQEPPLESTFKEIGICIQNEDSGDIPEPKTPSSQDQMKEYVEPQYSTSKKMNIGIQTQNLVQKTKKIKKVEKVIPKLTIEAKNQLSKQVEKFKPKKKKKTQQQIQRLKSQITSLFVNRESEGESNPDRNSMQMTLSCSFTSQDETHFTKMANTIEGLNNEIETFYHGKYLKSVILNQNIANFNRGKTHQSKEKAPEIENKFQEERLKGSKKAKFVKVKIISDKRINGINQFENPFNNQMLQKLSFEQEKSPKVKKEEPSPKSFKRQRSRQQKRRFLNQRYDLVLQNQSQNSQNKDFTAKEKQQYGRPQNESKRNRDDDLFSESQIQRPILSENDESQTEEVHLDPTKAWASEFQKQAKVIYEKYPQLRKYKLHKKVNNSENKQLQDDSIEKICDNKASKIVKAKRKSIKKKLKQKFSNKIAQISPHESEEISSFSSENKTKKQKKKPMVLKEIKIGQYDEEEFCKSFDHRSLKGENLSQISRTSQRSKRSQIGDDQVKAQPFCKIHYEENGYEKSHDFYFESFESSMEKKVVNAKLQAEMREKSDEISQSLLGCYSGGQFQERKDSKKSSSFYKSEERDYFYMSGQNPLNL